MNEDLDRDVLDAGAVPASATDDQVRRIRRGADDDVTVVTPRGGQRQPAGPARPPTQTGGRRDKE